MATVHVTTKEFEAEVLRADKPVLVDFWAAWCGPCQMVGPLVEQLSEETDAVKFVKVNIDEETELQMQYNVQSIPTFLLFKNGEVVKREVGALPKAQLQKLIEE